MSFSHWTCKSLIMAMLEGWDCCQGSVKPGKDDVEIDFYNGYDGWLFSSVTIMSNHQSISSINTCSYMKEGEKRLLLVKVAEKRIFSRRRGWHSMAQMTQQKLHLKLIFLGNIKNSLKTSKVEILGCLLTFFHSVSFFEYLETFKKMFTQRNR